jgi:gliding motility-associated-like protein
MKKVALSLSFLFGLLLGYAQTPEVSIVQIDTLCSRQTARLQVRSTLGGSFAWSTGESGSEITVSAEGTYSVTVSTGSNTATASRFVKSYLPPMITIDVTGDFCSEGTAVITAKTNGTTVQWNTGETVPSIVAEMPGTYEIVAATGNCKSTEKVLVDCPCKVWIPSAFTPEQNGINDVFIPISNSLLTNYTLNIYNRHGTLMFHSNSIRKGWDGTFNGKHVPAGVYNYVLDYKCEDDTKHQEKGVITVIW